MCATGRHKLHYVVSGDGGGAETDFDMSQIGKAFTASKIVSICDEEILLYDGYPGKASPILLATANYSVNVENIEISSKTRITTFGKGTVYFYVAAD